METCATTVEAMVFYHVDEIFSVFEKHSGEENYIFTIAVHMRHQPYMSINIINIRYLRRVHSLNISCERNTLNRIGS